MMISRIGYAAELEQAVAAALVLDQASEPCAPWGRAALDAAAEQYGVAGMDLPFEYQNDLYDIEQGGRTAFVLLH